MIRVIWLYLAALLLVRAESQLGAGVEIIEDIDSFLNLHPKTVVFFSEESCWECQIFSQIYTLVAQNSTQVAHFGKIYYTEHTKEIFTRYVIDAVPFVAAFESGQILSHPFEVINSPQTVGLHLQRWINRLWTPITEHVADVQMAHQVAVQCSDELTPAWSELRLTELWIDIACGQTSMLQGRFAVVYEQGEETESWEVSWTPQNARRLVQGYKYKHIAPWGNTTIHEIFTRNNSAFIMIVNNESRSRQLYGAFQQTKHKWYGHNQRKPVLFTVADLATHPQQTTRLKRFLVGNLVARSENYMYPLLLLYQPTAIKGRKYLCQFWNTNWTTDSVVDFLEQAYEMVLVKDTPEQANQDLVARWRNYNYRDSESESRFKDEKLKDTENEEQLQSQEKVKTLVRFDDWEALMHSSNPQPFIVYITWRNEYRLQGLERDVRVWWINSGSQFEEQRDRYDLWVHQLQLVDLPTYPQIEAIEFVPSLVIVGSDKKISVLEGVTELEKIQNFIKGHNQAESASL